MKNRPDRGLRVRPALRARRVRDVRRADDRLAGEHAGARDRRQRRRGLGRDVPARPDLPGGARRRRPCGAARAHPRADRHRPAQPRRRQRRDGSARCAATPTRRRRSTSPAGTCSGTRSTLPVSHPAGRRALTGLPALRGDPARAGGHHGRARPRPPRGGHPPLPAQARRRPARGRGPRARRAGDRGRRRPGRRRQRRLAPAGRGDRRPRAGGPRPRAVRAAVPDARGVPPAFASGRRCRWCWTR